MNSDKTTVENTDSANELSQNEEGKGNESLTDGQVEETSIENPIELIQQELSIANDKYLRLYSDFENYKKRNQKERIEIFKSAGSDVITSLLPVLDDFERALRSMETNTDVNAVKEGVVLIQNKLKNILSQKGLQQLESIGKPFDTDLHEAVTNVPVEEEEKKGIVVDEVEKGYLLNDKVIRHAKVVVGN